MSNSLLTNTPPADIPSLSPLSLSTFPAPLSSSSPPPQQQQQTLQMFTLFPSLPYEIRLKIYSHILSIPRVVSIAYITKPLPVSVSTDAEEAGHPEHGRGGGRRLFNSAHGGVRGSRRGRLAQGPRFVSRWVSTTGVPAALGVCRELREQALKICTPTFGSLESSPQIYFNYAVDTLYFGNASLTLPHPLSPTSTKSVSVPLKLEAESESESIDAAYYRLDLFLGGDYYGVSTHDFKRIRYLALDVAEDLYGRRSFCWEDIRGLTALEYVMLVAWEEDENEANSSAFGVAAQGTIKERCMRSYHSSLTRVWEKYAKGYGEGLGSEGYLGEEQMEWTIPKIEVWNACNGNYWGEVKLKTVTAENV